MGAYSKSGSSKISGLIKPLVFGAIITLTASYYGLATKGGTEGVGQARDVRGLAGAVDALEADEQARVAHRRRW